MIVHLKLIYLSSMFLRENFITAMIANSIMLLYRACRLEIINQESRSIRINPVLRLALSVSIGQTILRIYLQSNTLSTRCSGKFSCGKQRMRRGNKEKKSGYKFISRALIYNSNSSRAITKK